LYACSASSGRRVSGRGGGAAGAGAAADGTGAVPGGCDARGALASRRSCSAVSSRAPQPRRLGGVLAERCLQFGVPGVQGASSPAMRTSSRVDSSLGVAKVGHNCAESGNVVLHPPDVAA